MSGPLALLADSRLILTRALASNIAAAIAPVALADARAAYLGACNDDDPRHFEIFVAAMHGVGVTYCHHVRSAHEAEHVDRAHLVFLAGGDPVRGLGVLRENGLLDRVLARHERGALLIGSSAGAMLLGARVWNGVDAAIDGAALVSFAMEAHAEPAWPGMHALAKREPASIVYGLASGGGIWIEGKESQPLGAGYVSLADGKLVQHVSRGAA
jgi:cyanophycinase-like exopeptidase